MPLDPLSDVLSLVKPERYVAGGFNFGGDWAVQFEKHSGIKYFALVSGSAWLRIDGESEPIQMEAGDCVLLPNGRRFVVARDLTSKPLGIAAIPESAWNGGIATVGGGGHATMLGGHFGFSGAQIDILLGLMPAIVGLRDGSDRAGLSWILDRLRCELLSEEPGAKLVVEQLAHILLVQALRLYLKSGAVKGVGWLFALSDPRLAAAIRAVHADPGRRWTLSMLAHEACMSRSRFALRFKAMAGIAPIDYLTRWRMMLASDRLANRGEPISAVARALGYDSEAAFSTAFRRTVGCPPRRYVNNRLQEGATVQPT
jgi:AraC-like DNA-binding protein